MPANVTILLVDDNPMVREMLRQSLAAYCTVTPAADGTDACSKQLNRLLISSLPIT